MRVSSRYTAILSIVFLSILASGCATTRPDAKYKHALFDQMGINVITVMPVLDRRTTKTGLDLDDNIFPEVTPELKDAGYEVRHVKSNKQAEKLSLYDFLPKSQPLITSLDLEGGQWVMFIVVEKADSEVTFRGSQGYAHLSGYMYNRNTGEKVWEGVGIGKSINGLIFAALTDDEALERAARHLAQQMPLNSKLLKK